MSRFGESELYVVSDQSTGAPILYFARNGDLVKELNWSPYGQVGALDDQLEFCSISLGRKISRK